ncbi:MAG TPA: FecR domain-containing protein, partial [bacterium]|nr:FecR domain-containing protein [bacterium]
MLLLAGWILGAASAYGQDQDADVIASLQTLTGDVQVVQKESGQAMEGRAGLLLRAGDVIVTADQARATIKFRDGSEVRLFQNTRFVLQASKENAGSSRTFKLDLLLRAGALWGLFARQVETAKITTPTATIGVKGTTLRVLERDNKERVGLTEGVIEVTNARNSVELQAGTRLAAFGPQDDLTQKVQPIPYKIEMRADKRKLTFENGAEQ